MKKLLLLAITLIAFYPAFSQNGVNIKKAIDFVETIGNLPFYRLKTDQYLKPLDNSYYGYKDFHNTEFILYYNSTERMFPNMYKSDKKFKSVNDNFYLMPFLIDMSGYSFEDVLVSCNKNSGDVSDVLFIGQTGTSQDGIDIFIRQWSINVKKEVVVYELKLTTTKKVYFETAPSILNMKRLDTTYQIDDKGKFYIVSVKEYEPKDYKKEDLYRESKNIWEGEETPVN